MWLCRWPWAKLALSPLSGPLSHQKKGLQTRRGGSHSEKTRLVPLVWSGDSQGLLPCCSPDQCLHPGVRCTHAHMCSHVYTRTDTRTHSEPLLWTLGRATGPAQSWPLRSGSRCPRESHRDHSGKVGSRLPPAWRMGPAPKRREHSRERGLPARGVRRPGGCSPQIQLHDSCPSENPSRHVGGRTTKPSTPVTPSRGLHCLRLTLPSRLAPPRKQPARLHSHRPA